MNAQPKLLNLVSTKSRELQFKQIGIKIVENPLKTFDHKLGETAVRGFYGKVDGKDVVFFIYKEGNFSTQIATSIVPSPQQLINWGLNDS